jgi:uncharacterized protein
MSLLINLRHLETKNALLKGELTAAELDLGELDELIRVEKPLRYDLEAQLLEGSVLAQGSLELDLQCECARCLKPFVKRLELEGWACHLPLEGEEKAPVANDCVDLTPSIREDILLELPQHPLCRPDCGGLPGKTSGKKKTGRANAGKEAASAWNELNKLKF